VLPSVCAAPPWRVVIQNDGNVVLYDSLNSAVCVTSYLCFSGCVCLDLPYSNFDPVLSGLIHTTRYTLQRNTHTSELEHVVQDRNTFESRYQGFLFTVLKDRVCCPWSRFARTCILTCMSTHNTQPYRNGVQNRLNPVFQLATRFCSQLVHFVSVHVCFCKLVCIRASETRQCIGRWL